MTPETKSIFESKTVWGVIVMMLSHFLPSLGVNLDEASQGAISEQFTILIGAGLAIWGRFTAKAPIDGAS